MPQFKDVSVEAKGFIERCLNKDYKTRHNADELLKCKWI